MSAESAPPPSKKHKGRNQAKAKAIFKFPDEIKQKVIDHIAVLINKKDPLVMADDGTRANSQKCIEEMMMAIERLYNNPLPSYTPPIGKHLISTGTSTEEPIQLKAEVETQTESVSETCICTTDDSLSSGSKPKRSAEVHSAPMEVDPENEGGKTKRIRKFHAKMVIKGFPLEEDPEKAKVWLEPLGFKCTSASRLSSKRGNPKPLRLVLIHLDGPADDLLKLQALNGHEVKIEKFNRRRWSRNSWKQGIRETGNRCPPRPTKLSEVRKSQRPAKQQILSLILHLANAVADSEF